MKTRIATKHGDTGQTALAGGVRVSKSSIRVEAYGTINELNSCLGFARSICADREICDTTRQIQKELFHIGSALATPPSFRKNDPPVTEQMVDALTSQVHKLRLLKESCPIGPYLESTPQRPHTTWAGPFAGEQKEE